LLERCDADLIHCASDHLHDVEAVDDDLSVGEKLVNDELIGGIHVHDHTLNSRALRDIILIDEELLDVLIEPSPKYFDGLVGIGVYTNERHRRLSRTELIKAQILWELTTGVRMDIVVKCPLNGVRGDSQK
jgi:hypothetical protein